MLQYAASSLVSFTNCEGTAAVACPAASPFALQLAERGGTDDCDCSERSG